MTCNHKVDEYGYLKGKKYCYECCAELDREFMLKNSKITLYLTEKYVTNWPGTLKFEISTVKDGFHNIARTRTDVWFIGPDNHVWWGVNYGDFSQILYCKRTKQTV